MDGVPAEESILDNQPSYVEMCPAMYGRRRSKDGANLHQSGSESLHLLLALLMKFAESGGEMFGSAFDDALFCRHLMSLLSQNSFLQRSAKRKDSSNFMGTLRTRRVPHEGFVAQEQVDVRGLCTGVLGFFFLRLLCFTGGLAGSEVGPRGGRLRSGGVELGVAAAEEALFRSDLLRSR